MSLTLSEIEYIFREIVGDEEDGNGNDYRWSPKLVRHYANRVVNDICRQAKVLTDGTLTVSIVAGTKDYLLDQRVIDIEDEGVRLATLEVALTKKSYLDFDEENFSWETDSGEPKSFCLDYRAGYLTIDCLPVANDTASLRAILLPERAMSASDDVPEIPPEYHDFIPEMMAYHAYKKQDSQSCDPQAAMKFYGIGYDRKNPESYMNQIINMERAKRPLRRPAGNGGFF